MCGTHRLYQKTDRLQLELFFSKEPMIKLKAQSNQKILTNMIMCLEAQVIKPC